MEYEYGYGSLEDQLITLFRSGAPDFEAADKLLAQGADLNASGKNDDENILSEILQGYWCSRRGDTICGECENCEKAECSDCEHNKNPHIGESMVRLIKFFLAHGFDVNRKGGRCGAQCLLALVLSTFDVYTLIATKLLLDAGAKNISVSENGDEGETPWDFIATEGSYQDTFCHDHHLGNVYEAIYQVYQAVDDGRAYAGIDTYMAAIGKRVVRVLAEKPDEGDVFFDMDLPTSKHKNCYRQTLYFLYNDGMLITTQYADLWTNTVLPEKPLVDVSETFPCIVGSEVKAIHFGHNEVVEGTTYYAQPVTMIEMDTGAKLTISINYGEVKEEENRAAYFTLSFTD